MGTTTEAAVLSVRHWTDRLFSFTTTRDAGFRFASGQFVMLGLLVDGRPLLRAYSIASSPYDPTLEFFSIKVPDGALTSRLQHVRPGDKVLLGTKPTGTLLLQNLLPGRTLWLLATGTGLAPFLSIVRDLDAYTRYERVVLVHGVRRVQDLAYADLVYDGYVAPSFLATPGAKEVGVEVFSLSKGYNMTGWRVAAILGNADAIQSYWRLKTNIDSGLFEALQLAGVAALQGPPEPLAEQNATYARRRDLVVSALGAIGVDVTAPKGTIYIWAPVPEGHTSTSFAETVLEEAAVVVSPGSMYGPSGEGFFRISLTAPDERIEEAVERMREHLS